jgi:hypothetical protein
MRRSTRVPLGIQAELRTAELTRRGTVRNLSLGGAALDIAGPLPMGEACEVTLLLDGGDAPVTCVLEATVVQSSEVTSHLAFTAVIGLEGMEHLHYLLLWNANEPDRLATEFEQHVGLRPRG